MDEKFAERKVRAQMFRNEALAAMQAAEAAANEAAQEEFLRIAMEWLKLAGEIEQSFASSSRNGKPA